MKILMTLVALVCLFFNTPARSVTLSSGPYILGQVLGFPSVTFSEDVGDLNPYFSGGSPITSTISFDVEINTFTSEVHVSNIDSSISSVAIRIPYGGCNAFCLIQGGVEVNLTSLSITLHDFSAPYVVGSDSFIQYTGVLDTDVSYTGYASVFGTNYPLSGSFQGTTTWSYGGGSLVITGFSVPGTILDTFQITDGVGIHFVSSIGLFIETYYEQPVPEPGTFTLLFCGLIVLARRGLI